MTENQILKAASDVAAYRDEDGRWLFVDDEHLVEFVLEILELDRAKTAQLFRRKVIDFLNEE